MLCASGPYSRKGTTMTINWRSPRIWGLYGLAAVATSLILNLIIVLVGVLVDFFNLESVMETVAFFIISYSLLLFIVRQFRILLNAEDYILSFLKLPFSHTILILFWMLLIGVVVIVVSHEAGTTMDIEIIKDAAVSVAFVGALFGGSLLTSFLEIMSARIENRESRGQTP